MDSFSTRKKTKTMQVCPPKALQGAVNITAITVNIKNNKQPISEEKIEVVGELKYLGVMVDNTFRWTRHIANLQNKIRKAAYALLHLKNASNLKIMKQAYYAIVESHLRFGITAWGTSCHCKKLQKTQNKILKKYIE